jgi:glycosyltransferase involved in cell wall biosynthesis
MLKNLRSALAASSLGLALFRNFFPIFRSLRREFRTPRQVLTFEPKGVKIADILIIAPGEMSLPARGWGAVELLIMEQSKLLSELGAKVTILNSWSFWLWLRVWTSDKYSFVINHYDVFATRSLCFSRIFSIPLISISHYADLSDKSRWDPLFIRNFKSILKSDAIVALSPDTFSFLEAHSPRGIVRMIPNGVESALFKRGHATKDLIYLGKVEPRKRQVDFIIRHPDSNVDFVGDIVDIRFSGLPTNLSDKFLGPWGRDQVTQELHNYKALALFSYSEGDALVLYEAQAAGLGVIISAGALGSQDPELPWVCVLDFESLEFDSRVIDFLDRISGMRQEIHNHADTNYGVRGSAKKWLSLGLSLG